MKRAERAVNVLHGWALVCPGRYRAASRNEPENGLSQSSRVDLGRHTTATRVPGHLIHVISGPIQAGFGQGHDDGPGRLEVYRLPIIRTMLFAAPGRSFMAACRSWTLWFRLSQSSACARYRLAGRIFGAHTDRCVGEHESHARSSCGLSEKAQSVARGRAGRFHDMRTILVMWCTYWLPTIQASGER